MQGSPDTFYSDWKGTTGPGKQFRDMGINPDFNPAHAQLNTATRMVMEEEGVYKYFTLRERQKLNLWRKVYTMISENK